MKEVAIKIQITSFTKVRLNAWKIWQKPQHALIQNSNEVKNLIISLAPYELVRFNDRLKLANLLKWVSEVSEFPICSDEQLMSVLNGIVSSHVGSFTQIQAESNDEIRKLDIAILASRGV